MTTAAGYIGWTRRTLTAAPIIGGRQISGQNFTVDFSSPPAGIGIGLLSGATVHQWTANPVAAPMSLAPTEMTVEISGVKGEDDYHHLVAMDSRSQLDPVQVFLELSIEDIWLIRGAATEWTLSRAFPFATTGDYSNYAPTCKIVNHPNDGADASPVTLTVINSGTPTSSQVKVVNNTDGTTIETGDLSAHVGRSLVLRYHPLRFFRLGGIRAAINEMNVLALTIPMVEHIPQRTY